MSPAGAEVYGLKGGNVVKGSAIKVPPPVNRNWEVFQEDFSRLRGKSVWVIFAHNWIGDGVDEPAYALHMPAGMGVRIDAHLEYGAAAYLYELRPAPVSEATAALRAKTAWK